ncbi:MAG: hypothetical protein H8D69_00130 [Chloroflexi bacterium]|nr:hypothetical protein [Chloroflexota bacterium]
MSNRERSAEENFRVEFFSKIYREALPDDVAREIGVVTYGFSDLESLIDSAIYALLGDPPLGTDYAAGGIVVAELSFSHKVTMFGSLYVYRSGEDVERDKLSGAVCLRVCRLRLDCLKQAMT